MASWLLVFVGGFLIDVLYVFWMLKVAAYQRWQAGLFSMGLAIPAMLGYQEFMKDNWMMIPYLLGLFVGTVTGMTLDRRITNRGNET